MSHFDLLLVEIYSSIIHPFLKFVNKFQFDFEEEIEKKMMAPLRSKMNTHAFDRLTGNIFCVILLNQQHIYYLRLS